MSLDGSAPVKIQGEPQGVKRHTETFLDFLNQMQAQGLLTEQSEGLVLYADDQFVS